MVDVMRSLMFKLSYITKNFIRIRKTLQDLSLWDSESYGQPAARGMIRDFLP